MRKAVTLIFLSGFLMACGDYNEYNCDPSSVGSDLATAPLGGEYFGEVTLQVNTCDDPAPDSKAFDPFVAKMIFYPENEEQTSFVFSISEIYLSGVKIKTEEGDHHHSIDHKELQQYTSVYELALSGSALRGEMNLDFHETLYGGSTEYLGYKICEASYRFHLKKVVNYPYVLPPPKASSKVMVSENIGELISIFVN